MSVPNVLVLTPVFIKEGLTDIQAHVYEECVSLSKKVKLIIITQKMDTEPTDNITVIEIQKGLIPRSIYLQRIFGYLKSTFQNRKNFNLIFTRTFRVHYLISAMIAKLFLKKKFVMWIPATKTITFRKKSFQKIITKSALGVADILVTTSELVVNDLEETVGKIDRKKVRIVRNFTNTSLFKPDENIPTNNNILSVSRISPSKGIERIISALPLVLKEIPDVKFIHVGPIQNKKYWQSLKDLASSLGCEKSIEFRGPIHFEKLPNVYNSSKIFILATKSEGQSQVTTEAMSCGKPVIVTAVGGIPSYIVNEKNGFLIKNNDESNEIAEKVIQLLKDDDLREKIGRSARKSIEELSSEESFANELTDIFEKILSN